MLSPLTWSAGGTKAKVTRSRADGLCFLLFSDCKMSSAGDAIVETCCRQAQLAKGRKEEKNYKMQLFRSCHTSFVAFVRFSFAFVACREGNPSFVVG